MLELVAQLTVAPAFATYADKGVLGATVIVFAVVIVVLWKDNRKREDSSNVSRDSLWSARMADHSKMTEQLLQVNTQTVAALTAVTTAVDAHREAMIELRDALNQLAEFDRRKR